MSGDSSFAAQLSKVRPVDVKSSLRKSRSEARQLRFFVTNAFLWDQIEDEIRNRIEESSKFVSPYAARLEKMSLISSGMPFDIDLALTGTHVLVTGGCGYIGKVVVHAFLAAGCYVTILDITEDCPFDQSDDKILYQKADITNVKQMDEAFSKAEGKFGVVQTCIALASLDLSVLEQCDSLADMDPTSWQRVFDVNINGTFITCQRWLKSVRAATSNPEEAKKLRNVNLVIIGSESGRFGVPTMAAYAAGKSAVQYGLLHSLAQDAPRIFSRARVNAVAPGVVNTERYKEETASHDREWYWRDCEATVPLAMAIPPEDVARTILFLASERFSGSVHGQLLPIDGGKTGSLVWTTAELAARQL